MLVATLLLSVLQAAAWAQVPAQPGDPPGRVAQLNLVEGAVSFAPAEVASSDAAWMPAVLNRPLTSGDRLWTGPRARSELHIGSTAVRMNEQTSLDFLTLDDNVTQLRLAQGTVKLRVRALFAGQRLEINTPNLAFVITQPGDYRLDVNPASDTTRVVVQSGGGVIYGDNNMSVNLGSRQQVSFTGTQLSPAAPGATVQDSFDAWAADRDRREDQSVSARYVPRETIGYQQLDAYGDWRQDPAYGAVWLPRIVPVNWAPYRVGYWSWIAPWGWTWIDDAPWGFAPFHYGRWALIGLRWAWVPGQLAPRPVYAPALVVFVGGYSGGLIWNITISSGGAPQPGVGWFPLAPGEAFLPVYPVSPRYVTNINQNIVVSNTVNVTNIYRYQRQPAAVTAVSAEDFARGRPVRGNLQTLSAADLSRAQVAADGSAIPQRSDLRERSRLAAAALPPAAVGARPVVSSRDERRNDRRDDSRAGRPDNNGRDARTQPPAAAGPVGAQLPAAKPVPAMPPAVHSAPAMQDRNAIDAEHRARREQQQLQRDQERQQRDLARQQDAQRRQSEEALGRRALREQAQKNAITPPVNPQARAAAERHSVEQARQAQQQLQREQQRQQKELIHQEAQQRRQNAAPPGERAKHEQEQRKEQAQKRPPTRQADTPHARDPQPEGGLNRNREP